MKRWWQKLMWWLGAREPEPAAVPVSPAAVPVADLAQLYVMQVDFPLTDEKVRAELQRSVDRLRTQYGIDVLIIEPGIDLTRFDLFVARKVKS